MKKAKAVFWVTWITVGILAAVVISSRLEAILAALAGALVGLIVASVASSVVAVWPVLRVIWWWLPELALSGGLVTGWVELADHTGLVVRLITTVSAVGIPAAVGPVRRYLSALAWCQISRHRIRTCFNEFIITNRDGSLPLILGARPTPAGTRLWVFLRPGLSLADIQDRADKIAAACWANTVIADQASDSNSALVRIDIKRRDPLTGTIPSALKTFIGNAPDREPSAYQEPVNLDLTDVTAADVTTAADKFAKADGNATRKTPWPNTPGASGGTLVGKVVEADDVNDWI
jgi:hypothetical protein